MMSYMDQINTQSLKMVDEFSLGGIRDGWFPHQSKSRMPGLCACFHYMFTDVTGASDDQNLAFLSHSITSKAHSTPLLSTLFCSMPCVPWSLFNSKPTPPKITFLPFSFQIQFILLKITFSHCFGFYPQKKSSIFIIKYKLWFFSS